MQAAQFGSENWFVAGCPIQHRNCFTAGTTIPTTDATSLQPTRFAAANHNFAVEHTIQRRMLIRYRQLSFGSKSRIPWRQLSIGSESQIRSRQLHFSSESRIRCRTHNLAANANSLQTTQFR